MKTSNDQTGRCQNCQGYDYSADDTGTTVCQAPPDLLMSLITVNFRSRLITYAYFMLCPGLFLRSSDHVVAYTKDGDHIVDRDRVRLRRSWG